LNVARCRGQFDKIEQSIEQQSIAVLHHHALSDNFQHRVNLAGMSLLAGSLSDAEKILQELEIEFAKHSLSEQYISFHLQSRRQVLSYLQGDFEACSKQHLELSQLLQHIDWPSQPSLLRRHDMMADLIKEKGVLSAEEFDTYFVQLDPAGSGSSWPHFGRGIQFSELQFWSDS